MRPIAGDVDIDTAYRLSDPVRAMFGGQILHYTVTVPMTMWGVRVGDSVVLTSPQLPYAGKRGVHDPGLGMDERTMIVTGREWDIENGTGKLTGLVTGLDVAGYAPSARVASQSGATTAWVLTVDASRYAPSGGTDAAYFAVGDEVRIVEWDAASPTTIAGTVSAQSGNTISVTFDGAWTPGASTWILEYDASDASDATQRSYCYLASAVKRIDDGASGTTARVFAP